MLTTSWHLAHTLLSAPLNIGLLTPGEVSDAIEAATGRGASRSRRPRASCAR